MNAKLHRDEFGYIVGDTEASLILASPDRADDVAPHGRIIVTGTADWRKLADGDLYFVDNRGDHDATIDASFRVTGKSPELWHPENATSEPVSFKIADGQTTASDNDGEAGALDCGDKVKFLAFDVMEEQGTLRPGSAPGLAVDGGVDVTVGDDDVLPTVVVVVKEGVAPAEKGYGGFGDA